MATLRKKKAKGLPKRTGKRAAKYAHYFSVTMFERKVRHLLRHNGYKAAEAWADNNRCLNVLHKLAR